MICRNHVWSPSSASFDKGSHRIPQCLLSVGVLTAPKRSVCFGRAAAWSPRRGPATAYAGAHDEGRSNRGSQGIVRSSRRMFSAIASAIANERGCCQSGSPPLLSQAHAPYYRPKPPQTRTIPNAALNALDHGVFDVSRLIMGYAHIRLAARFAFHRLIASGRA